MSNKEKKSTEKMFWQHDEHDDHDGHDGNWLISYADLMTLLFGFFAILTVFSTPSSEKLEKLTRETAKSMGKKYEKPFNQLSNQLQKVLDKQSIKNVISIQNVNEGLILTASSTSFFSSASDELHPQAAAVLADLAKILKSNATGFNIVVEGHTDDVPISSKQFPSNWELSLNRASRVVRLFEKIGISHQTLRPVGLSDIEPIQPITNLSGPSLLSAREKNRRIVIRVIRNMLK